MEFTANQIAATIGGTIEGDGEVTVGSFAKIEEGRPGDLTFLANEKYTHFIYTTGASAVLVRRDFVAEKPVKATLIRVEDPYATLASLMRYVSSLTNHARRGIETPAFVAEGVDVPEDAYVGAFAYIGAGAKIGAGAQIYPRAYVGDGAVIGEGTTLYPGVTVYAGCRVGKRCIVHAGAVIGADGFGFAPVGDRYEKLPQIGIVEVGDDVEIGANTTIDRATMGATKIGDGVKLDNLIQIAHNCTIGENTVMASQCGIAGSTHIGSHCMFGGQVGVAGHITVGSRTQVGAQTGIPNNVEEGSRLMGYPATDARSFARQVAALKNLPDFMRRVNSILKENNNTTL